jgi:hypothetical protein
MDPAYKGRLLESAAEIFQAEGIEIPSGVKLNVVVDTPEHINLVLSDRPQPRRGSSGDQFYSLLTVAYNRAQEDPEFKEQLLANPTGTLEAIGAKLPEGTTISVHRETDAQRFFAVPLPPKARVKVEGTDAVGRKVTFTEGGPAAATMLRKDAAAVSIPNPATFPREKPTNVNHTVNVNLAITTNAAVAVAIAGPGVVIAIIKII